MTQTHPVPSATERDRVVAEYRREGYSVAEDGPGATVLVRRSWGGLVAHLALFFTVGWLTLGVLNLIYGLHKRSQRDRVRVVVQ